MHSQFSVYFSNNLSLPMKTFLCAVLILGILAIAESRWYVGCLVFFLLFLMVTVIQLCSEFS